MGVVYEAEAIAGGERFAVKVLDREWTKDTAVVSRFAREGRAATAAANDHIVRVLDGGTEDGCPYLVMELLQGEDLGKRLRKQRTLPIDVALRVADQVLSGLQAAHAHGVVHRDLKPDNVFLIHEKRGSDDADFAKIVDFGMSKIERAQGGTAPIALTRRGVILGTPLYMSPEQARAAPDLDARSDLYSLGAMIFECLAGRPPHVGPTYEQILIAICTDDAPDVRRWRPEVSRELAAFVARALAREPSDRFQDAASMRDALRAIAAVPSIDPRVLRRRAVARMVVVAIVAMLAGGVVTVLTLLAVALVGH
jgi:serine/threonine protein kinase